MDDHEKLLIELGGLTYEWNRLHQALGAIFSALFITHSAGSRTLLAANAAWNAISSDYSQREMLHAAAIEAYSAPDQPAGKLSNLVWLLDQTKKLSDKRNNAIHSPFIGIWPDTSYRNRRAQKLPKTGLTKEFNWYRETARALCDYGIHLHVELTTDRPFKLPDRPTFSKTK